MTQEVSSEKGLCARVAEEGLARGNQGEEVNSALRNRSSNVGWAGVPQKNRSGLRSGQQYVQTEAGVRELEQITCQVEKLSHCESWRCLQETKLPFRV